jgi:hypothetical protein
MRISQIFTLALLGASLACVPRQSSAQATVQNVRPNRNTQFLFRNGAVVQHLGTQNTPLKQNVVLPNGTKINVRSGIVELPTGKITSLHEGDYVNADGGIVFGSPASAAAARGDGSVPTNAKFDSYVHVGSAPAPVLGNEPNEREQLLMRKIELLNRKVSLLTQTHNNLPDTEAVDRQLQELDQQLKSGTKPAPVPTPSK